MRIESKFWSATLVGKWEAVDNEDGVTIAHPDGLGVLQLATYQQTESFNQESLQQLLAELFDENIEPEIVRLGDFKGLQLESESDSEFWLYSLVANDNIALFCSYTCELGEEDKELGAVLEILRSLRCN